MSQNDLNFLSDKKINAELYAYLQGNSNYEVVNGNRHTYVLKRTMPTQAKICDLLGIKSPKTYKTHLNYLIEKGYVIDNGDRYSLPEIESIYLLIPLKTLQYLNDNCKEHVIKTYIYLGQRYKQALHRGGMYEFTLEEIGAFTGLKVKNSSRAYEIMNNALDLLCNSELINFVSFFDGQMQKKKLTSFSFEYKQN